MTGQGKFRSLEVVTPVFLEEVTDVFGNLHQLEELGKFQGKLKNNNIITYYSQEHIFNSILGAKNRNLILGNSNENNFNKITVDPIRNKITFTINADELNDET